MIVRHYKRMRPHKTKKEKSTADDDESDWVQAAVAVAGLGLSLWDRHKKKEQEKDLVKGLKDKKSNVAYANVGTAAALQGELEYADENRDVAMNQLTEDMTGELKKEMKTVHDAGSSFSGSYRDTAMADDIGKSVWSGYDKGATQIDASTTSAKVGAYSQAFSSSADIRQSMDDIESQINSMT